MHVDNRLSDTGKVVSSVCRALRRVASEATHLSNDAIDMQWSIAEQHAIGSILIEQWRIDGQPLSIAQQLQINDHIQACTQRSDLLSIFGYAITRALAQNNVRAIIYKGLPLSQHLFRRYDARLAGDIDLLVAPHDLPNAARALQGLGFDCVVDAKWLLEPGFMRSFYEVEFRSTAPTVEIDVHWQLAPRWIAHPSRCHDLLRAQRTIHVNGNAWPWLDAADVWFIQCVELIKSGWIELKSVVSFVLAWDEVVAADMTEKAGQIANGFSGVQKACLMSLLRDWFGREVREKQTANDTSHTVKGKALAHAIAHILFFDGSGTHGRMKRKVLEFSKYTHHPAATATVLVDRLLTPHYRDLSSVAPGATRSALIFAKAKRLMRTR
jgi:Uncharacterised nucleotidyltransferase